MHKLFFSLLGLLLVFSCQTVKPLPGPEADPEIFNRHAQEAREEGNYNRAIEIYETLLKSDQVRPLTPAQKISVEYEIAFMYYRLERFDESRKALEKVLDAYKDSSSEQTLPGWVKALAEKLLADPKLSPAKPANANPEA